METSTDEYGEAKLEFIKCESCGFMEEYTCEYIARVREKYCGFWICGLCIEVVEDQVLRSERLISTEEALNNHITTCKNFQSNSSLSSSEHPISAMGKLLRRSLDSPRSGIRSNPSSPIRDFVNQRMMIRSGSCFSSFSR